MITLRCGVQITLIVLGKTGKGAVPVSSDVCAKFVRVAELFTVGLVDGSVVEAYCESLIGVNLRLRLLIPDDGRGSGDDSDVLELLMVANVEEDVSKAVSVESAVSKNEVVRFHVAEYRSPELSILVDAAESIDIVEERHSFEVLCNASLAISVTADDPGISEYPFVIIVVEALVVFADTSSPCVELADMALISVIEKPLTVSTVELGVILVAIVCSEPSTRSLLSTAVREAS